MIDVPELKRAPRFGDHIRVRRCLGLYWHHGIYTTADRVVQFGSGIGDKRHAVVGVTSMSGFAKRGRVQIVVHSGNSRIFGPVGPPDEPVNVVHRANWLLANHPPGRYHLIGWNCEHLATFCVNGFRESPQVRAILLFVGLSTVPLMLVVLLAPKGSRSFRRIVLPWGVIATWLIHTYRTYSARVWSELEDKWNRDHPPRA